MKTAALACIISTAKAYKVCLFIADDAFADRMSFNHVGSLVIVDDRAAIALDAGLKSNVADEVINPLNDEFAGSLATLLAYIEQNEVKPKAKV